MKNIKWKVALLAVVLIVAMLAAPIAAAPGLSAERGHYLVGFHGPPSRALVEQFGGQVYREFTIIDAIAVRLTDQAVEALKKNPMVSYVGPDIEVYALKQEVPWGIDRVFGDETYSFETWTEFPGQGIGVAVLDTGIDQNHEDLTVAGGYNFVNNTEDFSDGSGHGTHVAGTIAALDNEIGVVGVAPALDLYAVKVLDDGGSGTLSQIVAGIEWVVKQGNIKIINMSLGAGSDVQAFQDACDAAYDAGVLLVSSAGNSGNPAGRGDNVSYPAKYDSVIAVAASDKDDNRASFSSTGPAVELIAPGVGVHSAWKNNSYHTASGTSMASPHVAGAAALAWAVDSTLSNVQIRGILQETAEDLGLSASHQGYGMVRADWAVAEVQNSAPADTGIIDGTVSDTNNVSINGATVVVEGTSLSATTDAQGSYTISDVLVGSHSVTASAVGYGSETKPVYVTKDGPNNLNFELAAIVPPSTYTVSGTVKDNTETGLQGATVTIEGTEHSATTGDQGSYSIDGVEAGTYTITASKQGYTDHTQDDINISNTTTVNFTLQESTVQLMYVESITDSVRRYGPHVDLSVTVKVVHSADSQSPVSGATVGILFTRKTTGSTWNFKGDTQSDGTFTFTLKRAAKDTYTTKITALEKEGYEWDSNNESNVTEETHSLD